VSDPVLVVLCALAGAAIGGLWPTVVPWFGDRSEEALEQPGWTTVATSRPVMAVIGALAFGATAARFGASWPLVPGLALCALLLGVTAVDLRYRIVPNRIVAAGSVLGIALWLVADPGRVPVLLLAGVLAFAGLLVAAIASPGGLGLGDVKLAFMLGIFLGPSVAPAIFLGLVFATVPSLGLILRHGFGSGRRATLALGPWLALGAVVALLFGPDLLAAYWRG
jgi:leader peptidase (prepilin peptidase)/N-methyltransferase